MNAKSLLPQNISVKVQPFSREWLISFKNPAQLWTEHWFALVLEIVGALVLFQVFRSAKKSSQHSVYLVLTSIVAALSFELFPVVFPRPGYQLWWYHQGMVNFVTQRAPSYVITIYALVHYAAHNLTNGSNLPVLTRSLLTSTCASLVTFPCLWLSTKLLLLLLHFDDLVFKDRVLGVPYIQIVVVFLLHFHTSHLFQENYAAIEPQERSTYSHIKCALLSGLVAAMYAIVEQYLLYILLTLILNTHTSVCLVAAILILLYLAKDELQKMQMTSYSVKGILTPLFRKEFWVIFAAMLFTATLPLWLNTQNLKSTSNRLELGPCHIHHKVSNTSPLEIPRRRYVCPEDVHQLSFDLHCLTTSEINNGVKNRTKNYTVCGKKLENPSQAFKLLSLYSVGCLTIFYVVMLFSFTFKVQVKQIEGSCKKIE